MKNDFNYKWSKIFASKRFKREAGFITLAPIEQHELLKDAESLVKKLTLTNVVKQSELLAEHKCKFYVNSDWTELKCDCGKRIKPSEG